MEVCFREVLGISVLEGGIGSGMVAKNVALLPEVMK